MATKNSKSVSTVKSPKPKIDLSNAYADLTTSAQQTADNRFSVAKGVLDSQPHGLAVPRSPAPEIAAPTISESNELVQGQTYTLPLSRFVRSENNARVFYAPEELDETALSLTDNGQEVPVIGYVRDTKVVLVDGGKRFQAATRAGRESLRVEICAPPTSEANEYEQSRRVNVTRSTQTAIDDAVRWNSLLHRKVYQTHEELAQRNGVSRSTVTKTVQLVAIPERTLRKMNTHEKTRSLSTAYEIYGIFERLKDSPENAIAIAEEVIDEIWRESLNRNDAKTLIDARLDPRTNEKRTRETPSSTELKFGKAKGVLKIFPAKRKLDLTFTDLEPQQSETLKQLIEQMLVGQLGL